MKKIGSFTHKKYVLQRGKVMAKLALLRFILTASVMYFQWVCVHFSTPISIQNLWGLVTDINLSNFYWGELRRPIKLHAKLAKRKKLLVINNLFPGFLAAKADALIEEMDEKSTKLMNLVEE